MKKQIFSMSFAVLFLSAAALVRATALFVQDYQRLNFLAELPYAAACLVVGFVIALGTSRLILCLTDETTRTMCLKGLATASSPLVLMWIGSSHVQMREMGTVSRFLNPIILFFFLARFSRLLDGWRERELLRYPFLTRLRRRPGFLRIASAIPSTNLLLALATTITFLIIYSCTMYPGFGGRIHYGDSAEFHFLGVVDGVAHPSGYPLYLLICKLFVLLLGHIKSFEAVSYVSVVFGALTVGFIFLVAVQYSGSRIGALLVSALYGFSFTFWCQSTEAEVYTLQTFFVVAVTYFTILYYESGRAVYLLAGMFLFCMSFGAHLTMIFLAPSFVFLVIKKDRRLLKDVRVLAALFLFLVIGISQFGYLYYLSNLTPKPHLNTLPADASFIQVLKWAASGQYMGSIFFFKLQEMLIGRPKMLFGLLLDEFSIVGFILIVAGISASFMLRIKPAIVWFFVLHLTSHGIFAMGYRAPDSQVFFLPFSLSLVILSASLFVKRKSIIVQHTGRKSPAPSQEIGHNTPYPKSRLNLHLIFLFILAICMVVHRNTEIRGVSRTNNEVFAKIAAIVPHVPSGSAIYLGKKYINYHTGYGLNYLEKTKELGEHEFIRTRNIERNQLFVTNEGKKDLGNELFQFERQSGLRLDEFAKKYSNETILWVSQGPIGQNALVDRYFREVGSKIFAGRRKRSRYLGVVEKGRIRCERRNDQKTVAISHKDCAVLAKHCPKIYIEATRPGGMKKSYGNFPQGLRTKIEIDGEGWAVGLQGLNGLVLGENCRVIANVHFSIEPGSAESSDTVYCAERRNIVSN